MGKSVVFQGSYVKALKSNLKLKDTARILTGTDDPRSVATEAEKGSLYLRQNTNGGQVFYKLDDGTTTNWRLLSDGSGQFKVDLYDPVTTALPTGTSATIDGIAVADGDLVFFNNLALNNQRVYSVSGVGVSLVWTPLPVFSGEFNPEAGDRINVIRGEAFSGQTVYYDGTEYKINDVVRYFDGDKGTNYYEQTSLKTKSITNNTTEDIFTISPSGSENMEMSFSIKRGTNKEVNIAHIAYVAGQEPEIAYSGVSPGTTGVDIDVARVVTFAPWTTSVTPMSTWQSVTWSPELGLFVAVASSGTNRIMYSSDGISWSTAGITGVPASSWLSVTWSPELGLFVAVAYSGTDRVMYSSDGINWSTAGITGVPTSDWQSVTWSPDLGLFVAVAYNGTDRVMYSSDGINWSTAGITGVPASSWVSVTWSPELGLFVAVANNGTDRVMYSSDGINWSTAGITGVPASSWVSVTWSPELGLFVAVANNGTDRVMYSSDGINWSTAGITGVPASSWQSVTWSPELGLFVAVAYNGTDRVMYSSDGINWSTAGITGVPTSSWVSVTWSPELGLFVAVASSGTNRVMYSFASNELTLSYTSDNSGQNGIMKYSLKRWSDSPGGPSGIPNYSQSNLSSVNAAGNPTEIQFHGAGGTLDADADLTWTPGVLGLGDKETHILQQYTILNNQTGAVLFQYPVSYIFAQIAYSIERDGETRAGTLHFACNGTSVQLRDDGDETATTGVTISADVSGGNVRLLYDSTNTTPGVFKGALIRWQ